MSEAEMSRLYDQIDALSKEKAELSRAIERLNGDVHEFKRRLSCAPAFVTCPKCQTIIRTTIPIPHDEESLKVWREANGQSGGGSGGPSVVVNAPPSPKRSG